MFYCATFRGKGGGEATKGGRAFGPKVLKVLRFDSPFRAEGCGGRFAAVFKKGARLTAQVMAACGGGLCRREGDSSSGRGVWYRCLWRR